MRVPTPSPACRFRRRTARTRSPAGTRPSGWASRAPTRSPAASTRRCTPAARGRCGSTPGFGTAAESNERYHQLVAAGTGGLSVAFDLPTQMGYDSDAPVAHGEVGKVGVAIDSIEDMRAALRRHPARRGVDVDDDQRAGRAAAAALPAGRARSRASTRPRSPARSRTTCSRSTSPAAPTSTRRRQSLRLITDIFSYCRKEIPRWNTISISGYHMAEAGATPAQEIAFTLANGIEYVRAALAAGLDVDDFAPRLSFFFVARTTLLEEVAKFRAARRIWAQVMRDEFGAKDPQVADAALPHPDRRACSSPRSSPRSTWCGSRCRRWRRCSAAPSRCTPTPTTRRSRCRPRRRPGWRCAPSRCSPTRPT